MATNRIISQSKDDLKAAADGLNTFRTTFLREPVEIEKGDLPLFAVLDGVDADSVQEIDPNESIYDMRYGFDIVMVLDWQCDESEVISARNAWFTALAAQTKAAGQIPFRIESMRHYTNHWGNVEGWFVTMTLSRYTIEEFI